MKAVAELLLHKQGMSIPVWLIIFVLLPARLQAASFTNNARVEIQDPSGGLSWNTSNAAQTVSCWVKLSVPSSATLSDNMTILVDRTSGSESDPLGYLIRYNIFTGNIEYFARGASGDYTNALVSRPYLERWYHLAVVRQNDNFEGYVDGRQVFSSSGSVGNSSNNNGVSIGGWGSGKYLYGEVQEVAIYQSALSQEFITENMLKDQPALPELKGYFKLGYSTNGADFYKNFAPLPPTNTEVGVKQGSGTIAFEEVNQGGEQSAFDSRRNGGRDAIAPLAGGFSWDRVLLARPVPGIAFEFRIGYASGNSYNGTTLGGFDPFASAALGRGWRHTFDTRVLPSQYFSPIAGLDTLGLMTWNGAIETWDMNPDTNEYETRHKEYRGELQLVGSRCEWTTPERIIYSFQHPYSGSLVMRGRLRQIRDFNSNTVNILWNETIGIVTQVTDTAGGSYAFRYNAQYQLTNVTFQGWSVNLGFDASNRLVSVDKTGPAAYTNVNTRWNFTYNTNNLLEKLIDPRGITNTVVTYDQYGRKTRVADALNRSVQFEYGVPSKLELAQTDPAGQKWVASFDRKQHLLAQRDPLGNTTSYTYDEHGNRASMTEPLGWKTFFAYDDRANVTAITNALGQVNLQQYHPFFNKATNEVNAEGWVTRYTYDAHGNLLQQRDDLGAMASYTYRTNGLVETATDANGNIARFTYTSDGYLASKTDPVTNMWIYGRNELGWLLIETNPLGQVATFNQDINGNGVRTVDPLLRVFTRYYDPNGNLLAESDAKGQRISYAYDSANQKTQMTDKASAKWSYVYNSRGLLQQTINPLSNPETRAYDDARRPTQITDSYGKTVKSVYDANGNVIDLSDKNGQHWGKTYDRLNRVVSETDPLGNCRQTDYDSVGRVKTIATPNGYVSTHTYDGRGRLTQWVDAEGFEWIYDYDGNANITNITDGLGGHYVMAYGPRSERTMERNQDGFQWLYTYDALLHPYQQTDPNGTIRTAHYDEGGRIDWVEFSTGRIDDYSYDDNDNLLSISRSGSGSPTSFTIQYDVFTDLPTEYTDTFNKKIRYRYDLLGQATNVIYPDGKVLSQSFDALGRLTNQTDWAGRQTTYAYDDANRLVRRTYPNGIVQSNAFDNAGRLTALGYRSSGGILMAIDYAYDHNGNKTSQNEMGTLRWQVPARIDETADYTASGRLVSRDDAADISRNFLYYYDSSGNMTSAVSAVQSYSFTYDEDNRVMSVKWTSNTVTKTIANRYDGLGRRISRSLDGVETRYALGVVGGMERILCDYSGNTPVAWYLHGPDLCYKADSTGNLTCYHSDGTANITAMTDTNGTVIAQYSYAPYGRTLGTFFSGNGSQVTNNPFKFVGSQGVMEEFPELFFMRARYYSAEAGNFLSTDPVKHIGAGWKPVAYPYALGNPVSHNDPKGEIVPLIVIGIVMAAAVAEGYAIATTKYAGKTPEEVLSDPLDFAATSIAGGITASSVGMPLAAPAMTTLGLAGGAVSAGKVTADVFEGAYTQAGSSSGIEAAQMTGTVLEIADTGLSAAEGVKSILGNARVSRIHKMQLNPKIYINVFNSSLEVGNDLAEIIQSSSSLASRMSAIPATGSAPTIPTGNSIGRGSSGGCTDTHSFCPPATQSSMSDRTVGAATYGNAMTAQNSGSSFTRGASSGTPVSTTTPVSNPISNFFSAIGSFFGGLFGNH